MPNTLTFTEYANVRAKTYQASGNVLYWIPRPASIKKDVQVKWRLRRPGYEKKEERARFRHNEKIVITIRGSCGQDKRDEIEWFAKRDSLFKITYLDMKTYHAQETDDSTAGTPTSWSAAKSQGEEDVYVVIEKTSFTQKEAKVEWYDYLVTCRRASLTRH